MAGDWIKMRFGLENEPEVVAISEATGIDEDSVVGKLYRLWCWADQKTVDGNAPGVTKSWLDRYLSVSGFADALSAVGWLSFSDATPEAPFGALIIPGFEKHMSQSAKRRALTARRVAKNRGGKPQRSRNARGVTKSVPREEKRREDIGITVVIPKGEWPENLQTGEFEAAWTDWLAYRRESKHKKYTHTGAKGQLTRLSQMGPVRAVAAIRHSIAQGYKGIFEAKNGRTDNADRIGPGQRYDPNLGEQQF